MTWVPAPLGMGEDADVQLLELGTSFATNFATSASEHWGDRYSHCLAPTNRNWITSEAKL